MTARGIPRGVDRPGIFVSRVVVPDVRRDLRLESGDILKRKTGRRHGCRFKIWPSLGGQHARWVLRVCEHGTVGMLLGLLGGGWAVDMSESPCDSTDTVLCSLLFRACEEEAAGGGEVASGHTLEAATRQTRQPACAKRWRGPCGVVVPDARSAEGVLSTDQEDACCSK